MKSVQLPTHVQQREEAHGCPVVHRPVEAVDRHGGARVVQRASERAQRVAGPLVGAVKQGVLKGGGGEGAMMLMMVTG